MTRLIREGDRSPEVADIQVRLRSLGIQVDDEPGVFGTGTVDAVRGFQQRRDLLVDGIVGPQTWRELVGASWHLGDRNLYLGNPPMRGDDVATLQAKLNALGFDVGRDDGIFGPRTMDAVRAFQREYGVAEDGIFGPASLAALRGLRIERAGTAASLREQLRARRRAGLEAAVIVLDPGHGGDDPGAGGTSVSETDLCWDLSRRIAARLSAAGADVHLTRTADEGPDGSERARRANKTDADLFVSVHLNAHTEASAGGASTYYFSGSRAGEELAEMIQQRLLKLGLRDCRSHARSYSVLKETRMPAVLVEPVFISNPDEAARIQAPEFRDDVADAIVAAINDYFDAAT